MSTFPYPPLDLDQNSIRLLHVKKGAWPNDVSCSLFEATTNPDEVVPYKALSYTWGAVDSEDHTHNHLPRIIVNEQEFPATDNLRLALSYIQRPSHDIVLWTDAICINQKDDREKGHQVKQMAQIYKNAEEVLIWLGPSNEEIKGLLDFVPSMDQQAIGMLTGGSWGSHCHNLMREQCKNAKTIQNVMALKQLLDRRWFKRIWVLQEVAFARSARIICGSSSCSARTFSLMPSSFEIPTTDHSQAVLDLMPRIRSHTWWARDRTLHNLLVKFRQSRATDERDMIYALLSMSQDACDSTLFYPSYEIRTSEVLKNTASILIFGQMHVLRAELPDIPIGHLARPLGELITFLLKPTLRENRRFKETSRKHRTLEETLREYRTLEETYREYRVLEETYREYRTLEDISRERSKFIKRSRSKYRTLRDAFRDPTFEKHLREYDISEEISQEYRTLERTSREYRTLVERFRKYLTLEDAFREDRKLEEKFRKDRTLKRPSVEYRNLEGALCQFRESRLSEMDKSLSSFTKQLHHIDLDRVQILHCLSTFLSIALTSPKSLKAWFRIRTPKLLTAIVRAECSELQIRTKEKPGSILTLIFEQQNVPEEYRLMEFPVFDRFDDLERLHFPEDFDLPDCRDGYDSFKRFIALIGPIDQTSPTEDKSLA